MDGLHSMVFQYKNLELIKLLNQYIPIQCNHIKDLFQYLSPLDIGIILNEIITPLTSTSEFKNNSIFNAFKSYKRDEILEFILNNTHLYNIPPQSNKKFKLSNGSSQEIKNNNNGQDQVDEQVNKLQAHNILDIRSKKVRSRLLELGYFNKINKELFVVHFRDKTSICFEKLKEIFHNGDDSKCYLAYYDNAGGISIINDDTKEQQNYLVKHDTPLDGTDLNIIYKYALESFSVNSLQYLLSLHDINSINGKIKTLIQLNYNKEITSKRSNEEMVSFIEIYTTNYQLFENLMADDQLYNYINLSKSKEQYQTLVNAISPSNIKNQKLIQFLNKPWNLLVYNRDNVLKDKSSIDWLIENNHEYPNSYSSTKFGNIELLEYAYEKQYIKYINVIKHYVGEFFKQAVLKFDIELLIKCQQFSIGFANTKDLEIINEYCSKILEYLGEVNDDNTTERIIQFYNHLNTTNFKLVSLSNFIKISLPKLIKNQQQQEAISRLPSSLLSNLDVNFNKYLGSSVDLFSEYTSNFSLIAFQLFIDNNFNPMKTNSNLFLESWNKCTFNQRDESYYHLKPDIDEPINHQHKCLFYLDSSYDDYGPFYNTSNESPNSIITFIQQLVNQFNIDKQVKGNGDGNDGNFERYYNCISVVVNYLLNKLIRSKFTSIVNVKFIRNFIINNLDESFQFEHSTFQSYYYILLKSPRLLMFIMKLQQLVDHDYIEEDGDNDGDYINYKPLLNDDGSKEEYEALDFIPLIDPRIFTFEYLLGGVGVVGDDDIYGTNNGEAFNNILENLIQQLVHLHVNKYSEFVEYNIVLNKTLIYLLEIKHFNLLFKQLKHIKQLFKDNSNSKTIDNSPTKTNFEDDDDCCGDDDNNGKNGNQRIFEYSIELILIALKNLDSESFKTFIEFSNFQFAKTSLTNSLGYIKNRTEGFQDKFINIHIESIKNVFNHYNITF